MRMNIFRAPKVIDSPAMLHVEPDTDEDRETLRRVLTELPELVQGLGINPETMKISHMQLGYATPTQDDSILVSECDHSVVMTDFAVAECSKCKEDLGWYCPASESHLCEYQTTEDCVWCGQPEERQ